MWSSIMKITAMVLWFSPRKGETVKIEQVNERFLTHYLAFPKRHLCSGVKSWHIFIFSKLDTVYKSKSRKNNHFCSLLFFISKLKKYDDFGILDKI